MSTYIAMLRGINVSGHKPIKMEVLRVSFEALGFSDVSTYVQSGNVVFKASKTSATALTEKITKKLLDDFKYTIPVAVRTSKELDAVLKNNPFSKERGTNEGSLYVTFLSIAAPKGAEGLLKPLATASEQIFVDGREVYLYCPNGYGTTKVSNTAIEKKLLVQATTRNWRTVNALAKMAGDHEESN